MHFEGPVKLPRISESDRRVHAESSVLLLLIIFIPLLNTYNFFYLHMDLQKRVINNFGMEICSATPTVDSPQLLLDELPFGTHTDLFFSMTLIFWKIN